MSDKHTSNEELKKATAPPPATNKSVPETQKRKAAAKRDPLKNPQPGDVVQFHDQKMPAMVERVSTEFGGGGTVEYRQDRGNHDLRLIYWQGLADGGSIKVIHTQPQETDPESDEPLPFAHEHMHDPPSVRPTESLPDAEAATRTAIDNATNTDKATKGAQDPHAPSNNEPKPSGNKSVKDKDSK